MNIGWRVDILSTVNTVWYSMNYCGYFFPNKPPLLNKGESGTSLFKLMRVHIKMINGWIIDTLYTTLRGFQGCLYFIVMIKPTLVASFCNTKPYILHLGITGSNKKIASPTVFEFEFKNNAIFFPNFIARSCTYL